MYLLLPSRDKIKSTLIAAHQSEAGKSHAQSRNMRGERECKKHKLDWKTRLERKDSSSVKQISNGNIYPFVFRVPLASRSSCIAISIINWHLNFRLPSLIVKSSISITIQNSNYVFPSLFENLATLQRHFSLSFKIYDNDLIAAAIIIIRKRNNVSPNLIMRKSLTYFMAPLVYKLNPSTVPTVVGR